MFPLSLAPTSTPKRWYSNQHSVQDEFDELAYLEAKYVHDREQALEVRCPIIIPSSALNNTSIHNSNNNDNSVDDPSMDDMDAQVDINDSDDIPSSEMGIIFTNNPPINNNDDNDDDDDNDDPGSIARSISFISQPNDQSPSSQQHYYNNHNDIYRRRRSSTSTPSMMGSYSTPNRMTITPNMQFSFFTPPTQIRTSHGNPPSTASPDFVNYMSSPPSPPPPAGRSLRQYMDESSRSFMEPEMMDRLIRYDDDDDGSPQLHRQHSSSNNNDDDDDERRRLRRPNLFE